MLEPLCDPLKRGTGVFEDRSCTYADNESLYIWSLPGRYKIISGIAHIYTAQSTKCEQGHTKQVHLSKRVSKDSEDIILLHYLRLNERAAYLGSSSSAAVHADRTSIYCMQYVDIFHAKIIACMSLFQPQAGTKLSFGLSRCG